MRVAKKYWAEFFFTGGHLIFSLSEIIHEFISGDLDEFLNLNWILEIGSTLFGIIVIITLFRYIKSAINLDK